MCDELQRKLQARQARHNQPAPLCAVSEADEPEAAEPERCEPQHTKAGVAREGEEKRRAGEMRMKEGAELRRAKEAAVREAAEQKKREEKEAAEQKLRAKELAAEQRAKVKHKMQRGGWGVVFRGSVWFDDGCLSDSYMLGRQGWFRLTRGLCHVKSWFGEWEACYGLVWFDFSEWHMLV